MPGKGVRVRAVSDQIDMLNKIEQFAARKKVEPAPPWDPPTLEDFARDIHVQALDQALANTALVDLTVTTKGVEVHRKVTIRPKTPESMTSFTHTYEQASLLRDELQGLIFCSTRVVYEMPVVQGWRADSSLMAGYVIYDMTRELGQPAEMVSKNHVGAVLCNDPYASKKEVRLAVARYIPEADTRRWNEHACDAAAIGLTHLYDLKRQTDG